MSATREKAQLLSASEIDRTLVRLAHEILEKSSDPSNLAFIGIKRRGVPMAERLARKISELEKIQVPCGVLDIKLYRDDLSQVDEKPVVSDTKVVLGGSASFSASENCRTIRSSSRRSDQLPPSLVSHSTSAARCSFPSCHSAEVAVTRASSGRSSVQNASMSSRLPLRSR